MTSNSSVFTVINPPVTMELGTGILYIESIRHNYAQFKTIEQQK